MATTSIWSIKGWLGKLVIYVENPEKTEQKESASDISDEKEELMQQYVSGVNCSPMTAREEMIAVKKRFGKDGGIIAFHGYQSFAPGECTPVMAHEIGVKLAEKLWGERFQVIVATHLDKAHHLHNHFVVNSVSFNRSSCMRPMIQRIVHFGENLSSAVRRNLRRMVQMGSALKRGSL